MADVGGNSSLVMHHKKIPTIADESVARTGALHFGRPVIKILNQRLWVGGGKDVAFDDAVVKESVNDICHDQAGIARTKHAHQLFVGVEFYEKICVFVICFLVDSGGAGAHRGLWIPTYGGQLWILCLERADSIEPVAMLLKLVDEVIIARWASSLYSGAGPKPLFLALRFCLG